MGIAGNRQVKNAFMDLLTLLCWRERG